MAREKGAATAPCANCGKELAVQELPDGGVSTVNCDSCYPAPKPEVAAAPTPARETGTPNVPKED